ncbi:hypothetical protein BTS2_1914 [Bacillus sp. TS-2]|nr:hypothetical protein BTS2_1914 [Bacillus sp. TS-2]
MYEQFMKKVIIIVQLVFACLLLIGCNSTTNGQESTTNIKKNGASADKVIAGEWKFAFYDFYTERETNFLNRYFSMDISKDGFITITYENNDTLDQRIEDLSEAERILNNAFKTTATYKINDERTNLNDTYENNTILFNNIHLNDSALQWGDFSFEEEETTDFFQADLVQIEAELYFSSVHTNNYIQFEDDEVVSAIDNGDLIIEERANNHLKYSYKPTKSRNMNPSLVSGYFRNDKLVMMNLPQERLVVNVDDWESVDSISVLFRDGVVLEDSKEEVEDEKKEKEVDVKKETLLSEVPKTEVDRRVLALFKKLYNEEAEDYITVHTGEEMDVESIKGSLAVHLVNDMRPRADFELQPNGDIEFFNESGGSTNVDESKKGNLFSDVSESEWLEIREDVTLSIDEIVAPMFFGEWKNGFNDPNRGVCFIWNDLDYIDTLCHAFEATSDLSIDFIEVISDNQIIAYVSGYEWGYSNVQTVRFELKLNEDDTMNIHIINELDDGTESEELIDILFKE